MRTCKGIGCNKELIGKQRLFCISCRAKVIDAFKKGGLGILSVLSLVLMVVFNRDKLPDKIQDVFKQ